MGAKRSWNKFLDDRDMDPASSTGWQKPQKPQEQKKVVIPA